MAVISFRHGEAWKVARWAFRGVLELAVRTCEEDERASQALRQAIALDGLHLGRCEPELAVQLTRLLAKVAEGVLRGECRPVAVEGRTLDEGSQRQFREAIHELLGMLQDEMKLY